VPARFAVCFHDERRAEWIEHEVVTLVGQRVFGIALGYEDLNDHDELRHDPVMAILAGKLTARREDCAPVAGKSTLNRLELSKLEVQTGAPVRCSDGGRHRQRWRRAQLAMGSCAAGVRDRAPPG
jgi:Transposase DDE domain group 1